MLWEVFHCREWQAHSFCHVVARPSEAPIQLCCQSHELVVDCGKEDTGVDFVKHGVQQNWQGGELGESQIDFLPTWNKKEFFFPFMAGVLQCSPYCCVSPTCWQPTKPRPPSLCSLFFIFWWLHLTPQTMGEHHPHMFRCGIATSPKHPLMVTPTIG